MTKENLLRVEEIAQVCHEANRELQRVQGEVVNPPWEQLNQELRDSAINGVEGVLTGNTPEESHQNWLAHRESHGWVYGPVKDFEAKTHPCLVPYHELPVDQKRKDHLFVNIVEALA